MRRALRNLSRLVSSAHPSRWVLPVVIVWMLPGVAVADDGWGAGGGPVEPGDEAPALVIAAGSLARQQLVALGRDMVVEGRALADVAAVNGSILVSGSVAGDVIVLGGTVRLEPTAHVEGDVFVLGGTLTALDGARIDGRAVAHPTFSSAWLTLLEGPSLGGSPLSAIVVGAKLALVAAWLLLTLALLAVSGREVRRTSEEAGEEPLLSFMVGLTGVLAMFLTALFFSSFAALFVGVPLLVLVVVLALVLKLWGMVAVFHALGVWLLGRLGRSRANPVLSALLGLALLGALKLVPYVGVVVWTVATIVGIGSTLRTKFGRLEPWFDATAASPIR